MTGRKRYRELEEALATASQLRQTLAKFSAIKDSDSAPPQPKKIKRETALALVRHKAANRNAYLTVEAKKSRLESLQESHFKANLRLQNLLCQEEHLKREIEACKAFRSSHEKLGLNDEKAENDESESVVAHEVMLERLTFELNERKRLRSHIHGLKERSIVLQKDIHEKSSFLSSLQGEVAKIHRACRPVQKQIPAKFQQQAAYEMAQLLPVPLYTIYYQLAVYREAFDKDNQITVDIEGSKEAATNWNKEQSKAEEVASASGGHSGNGDNEATAMDTTGDVSHDNDDDMDVSVSGEAEEDTSKPSKNAADRHPLAVVVKVSAKDCASVTIRFFYLYRLNIVSVASDREKEGFLTSLYPCDIGKRSPNAGTSHLLGANGALPSLSSSSSTSSSLGSPYHWAQRMAGLHFLAATQEENSAFLRPETEMDAASAAADALSRISRRLLAREALADAVTALGRGQCPSVPGVASPAAQYSGWAKISRSEYQETAGQERLEEWQHADAAYYKLHIGVDGGSSYQAALLVPADYPSCPALVHLAAAAAVGSSASQLPAYVVGMADKAALAVMESVTAQTSSYKTAEAQVNVNVGRFVPSTLEHHTFALQIIELAKQLVGLPQ